MVAETCGNLLDQLEDDTLRRVAVMKMEGWSNDEIAEELECVSRTVERKLGPDSRNLGRGPHRLTARPLA